MVKAEDNNAGMEIPDTRYAKGLYTGKNQNEVKITPLDPQAILEQGYYSHIINCMHTRYQLWKTL